MSIFCILIINFECEVCVKETTRQSIIESPYLRNCGHRSFKTEFILIPTNFSPEKSSSALRRPCVVFLIVY